jgi:hypothetical protein
MLKERLPSRLTPLAARFGLRPFYGDVHNHCGLSYGHGSLEDALRRAKRQLDFASVTGHASWPDMPVDDPRVAHIVDFHVKGFARLAEAWPGHFRTLRTYQDDGAFTVFPGYEIHSSEHGDYTILYRDLEDGPLLLADSPAELRALLERHRGGGAFAFPHHIGYRRGARGINWGSFDPRLSPVVEIVSMHGCSETSLTDRPFLHSMGPSDGHSTARYGLALGHVFGFLGNTDHHSGYPGSYGHGRTCIYATENNRDALWDSIWSRRTNALTGDCSHLFIALGDHVQGSVVERSDLLRLSIEAVGGSFIDFIDIVHNGSIVKRITPDLEPAPIHRSEIALETLLVLELGWGERGKVHRWEGSVEVLGGEILAVEPRLRGPEVVSPLEGSGGSVHDDRLSCAGSRIDFELDASANPNNLTSSTQAIAARVRIKEDSLIRARFGSQVVEFPATRLKEGALAGNLGPIDSPAYRFHPLPTEHQWQWQGTVDLFSFDPGDHVYARMRQTNSQWTWASPIFRTSGHLESASRVMP